MEKGVVEFGLLWVLLILIAIFLLAAAIPMILRAIGLSEWGNLIDKLNNLQKYKGEGVTIFLPTYIESVMFFKGENEECRHSLCKDMCLDSKGKPCKGNTFIVVIINKGAKPTFLGILGKVVTFQIDKAKAESVKMVLRDACLTKDYEINSFEGNFVQNGVLILEGDRKNGKTYCIKIEEISGKFNIHVKEGPC